MEVRISGTITRTGLEQYVVISMKKTPSDEVEILLRSPNGVNETKTYMKKEFPFDGVLFDHILEGHEWFDDGKGENEVKSIMEKIVYENGRVEILIEWANPTDRNLMEWKTVDDKLKEKMGFLIENTKFKKEKKENGRTCYLDPRPIPKNKFPIGGQNTGICLVYALVAGIEYISGERVLKCQRGEIEKELIREREQSDTTNANSLPRAAEIARGFQIIIQCNRNLDRAALQTPSVSEPGRATLVTVSDSRQIPANHCIFVDNAGNVFDSDVRYKHISQCNEVTHEFFTMCKKRKTRMK